MIPSVTQTIREIVVENRSFRQLSSCYAEEQILFFFAR